MNTPRPEPIQPCPELARLTQWCDGSLAETEQATIAAHVEQCPACQSLLDRVGSQAAAGRNVADRLKLAAECFSSTSPPLAAVIRELKSRGEPSEAGTHDACVSGLSPDLPPSFLASASAPGQLGRLGDYDVLEEVGRGTMGIVLRAFDRKLHRVVAIKVLSPHLATYPLARQRFVREGHSAAAVCHENVVTIHAVDESAGLPYLVMQYVEGKTLQKRLDQTGPLRTAEVLRIGMQAASGLAAAHAQGLIHRDIKPDNLLLENGIERVKLTDFGLARAVDDASLTQTGIIAGTPQFMAPEQARGETLDARADLFSLGCVLYALCTGTPPFRASGTLAVLKRICEDTPRPIRDKNPEVPVWLAGIVMKLLAKNPADRFQTAQELAELLGRCLAHVQQPANCSLPENAARLAAVDRSTPTSSITTSVSTATPRPDVTRADHVVEATGLADQHRDGRRRQWLFGSRWGNVVLLLCVCLPLLSVMVLDKALDRWWPPASATRTTSTSEGEDESRSDLPLSSAEVAELARMVELARKNYDLVKANYDRGVLPRNELFEAEIAWRDAQIRQAIATHDRLSAQFARSRVVEIRAAQLEVIKKLVQAQQVSSTEVFAAERKLSEARLARDQAK